MFIICIQTICFISYANKINEANVDSYIIIIILFIK